jgi:hypothetical protein
VKLLIAFLIGVLVTMMWIRPYVYFEKPEITQVHDTITKVAYGYQRQVFAMPGRFDKATMRMLEDILEIDSSQSFTEPDSSNTRIFWLDAWPVKEETVIVETYAGNTMGSCGASIEIARYDSEVDDWVIIKRECGAVDTILPISHNGLFDFVIRDKWDQDHYAFRFDGIDIVETKLAHPPADAFEIENIICGETGFIPGILDIQLSYLNLGVDSVPFIIASEGILDKYLFIRGKYGKPELIAHYPESYQIDFMDIHHNGMPDMRTLEINYSHVYYEWDGTAYDTTRTVVRVWSP